MTTLTLKTPKPRNPLVAAARFRRAGKHGANGGARRQAERQATRREACGLESARPARDRPPRP